MAAEYRFEKPAQTYENDANATRSFNVVSSNPNVRAMFPTSGNSIDILSDTLNQTSTYNYHDLTKQVNFHFPELIGTGEMAMMNVVCDFTVTDTDSEVFNGQPVVVDITADYDTSTMFDLGKDAFVVEFGIGDVFDTYAKLAEPLFVRSYYSQMVMTSWLAIIKRELNGVMKFKISAKLRHTKLPNSGDDSFNISLTLRIRGLDIVGSYFGRQLSPSIQSSGEWENL